MSFPLEWTQKLFKAPLKTFIIYLEEGKLICHKQNSQIKKKNGQK